MYVFRPQQKQAVSKHVLIAFAIENKLFPLNLPAERGPS